MINTKEYNYFQIDKLLATLIFLVVLSYVPTCLAFNETMPVANSIDKSVQSKGDINHFVSSDKVTSLLAGPDSYMMIINKNNHVVNNGVMVLIPDWEQAVIHPKASHFLQNIFPQNGWTTIAVLPPNKPKNYPSMALDKKQQIEENEVALSLYTKKLTVLVQAMIKKARTYPGSIFIVSQGNNAIIIADILALNERSDESFSVDGLILLSSYLYSDENNINKVNTEYANRLAHTDLPILDLALKYDHLIAQTKAQERNILAKRERKVFYRHRKINNTVAGVYPEKDLISQIKRWLVSIGW